MNIGIAAALPRSIAQATLQQCFSNNVVSVLHGNVAAVFLQGYFNITAIFQRNCCNIAEKCYVR